MTLRSRILTGLAVVVVLLAGLGIAMVAAQRGQLIAQLDRQLESVAPLERPVPRDPQGQPPPNGLERPAEEPISDIYIAMVRSDGVVDVLVRGQLLEADPDVAGLTAPASGVRSFTTVDSADGSTSFRALLDPGGPAGVTVIATPTTEIDETVRNLIATYAIVALLVAGVLGLLAWWIVRLGLRPISAVTAAAEAIAAGDREQRAPAIDDRTEAGQMASAFNVMLDQRDEAEGALRRFASDASHELRTPLTSIRGYLDVYQAGGFREPGQLDDAVRRMRDESVRMGDLVEQLLQLARLDEARVLDVDSIDVGRMVGDVVANARAAHPDRAIEVAAPPVGDLIADADHDRLKQVVTVLVDNAITHAPDARIEVAASAEAGHLKIVVSDDGPGLDEDDASHAFERFYRSENSRSRASGGSGLGLAIARSIVEAHGGTIRLRSSPGRGCEFSVDVPHHRRRT